MSECDRWLSIWESRVSFSETKTRKTWTRKKKQKTLSHFFLLLFFRANRVEVQRMWISKINLYTLKWDPKRKAFRYRWRRSSNSSKDEDEKKTYFPNDCLLCCTGADAFLVKICMQWIKFQSKKKQSPISAHLKWGLCLYRWHDLALVLENFTQWKYISSTCTQWTQNVFGRLLVVQEMQHTCIASDKSGNQN